MNFLAVGLSHNSAPVQVLERVAIPTPELHDTAVELLKHEHIEQVVVLATCNRVEVYAHVSAFHPALAEIAETLGKRASIDVVELAGYCYAHYGQEAIRHLLRVAAGLDSMVIGEPQILGQLRSAYAAARAAGTVGTETHELMQYALRVGKRIRSETELDHAGQSMVGAALAAAPELGDLAGKRALVIGAGSMAALAAATLRRADVGALTIVNRTIARAENLAAKVDGLAGGLDDLEIELAKADLVITATGSPQVILPVEMVRNATSNRAKPLVICDLALPRDVASEVGDLALARLVSIATLDTAEQGAAPASIAAAERILDAELAEFAAVLRQHAVTPAVTALRSRAEAVVRAELAALRNRLPGLSTAHAAELERTVRRVVATLLHEPTVKVKELSQRTGKTNYVDALTQLFGLDVASAPVSVALNATTNKESEGETL